MPPTLTFADLETRLRALGTRQLEIVAACAQAHGGLRVYYLGRGTLRVCCRGCGEWLLDVTQQQMAFPPFAEEQAAAEQRLCAVEDVPGPVPSTVLPGVP
jgi:hypothetical protein